MRGAHSISTRRAYGLQRICRVWQLRSLQGFLGHLIAREFSQEACRNEEAG